MRLSEVLELAKDHWGGRKGEASMVLFAQSCVNCLGEDTRTEALGVASGVKVLACLRDRGLSANTVRVYYGAFKRALLLAGVDTLRWPKAPTPPRKTRDPMSYDDCERLIEWLAEHGHRATSDLALLLRHTGVRVAVEGLEGDAIGVGEGDRYTPLHVTGKGGHERTLPVVDARARALLLDAGRMDDLRALPYWTHLRRWNAGVAALGITSRLATPHSVRHLYACEALKLSGGNLVMVQELLGHSDPRTTARYLSIDLDAKAQALAGGGP